MDFIEAFKIVDKYNAEKRSEEIRNLKCKPGPTDYVLLHESREQALSEIWRKKRDELNEKTKVKCELVQGPLKSFHDKCSFIFYGGKKCKTHCKYYTEVIEPISSGMDELREAMSYFKKEAREAPYRD